MAKIKQLLSIFIVTSILVLPAVSKVCPPGDLSGDCYIDFYDMAVLAQQWLNQDCCEQGLTSYWQFDEDTGDTAHDSIGENHAPISGATWTDGKLGTALEFSSYGDCVDIGDIELSGDWTVCFWVKAHSRTTSAAGSMVFGNSNEINNYFRIIPNYNARLRNNAGEDVIWETDADFYDRWRLMTIVASEDGIELYLDGMSQGATIVGTEFKLYHIGRGHTTNIYDFYGLIDEFKVYDRSLSAEEVLALAKTGTSVLSCGNINGSGGINMGDFAIMAENWQQQGPDIVINEFMASNSTALSTVVEGQTIYPDWIELYNQTQDNIYLTGWYLTDDVNDPNEYWRILDGVTIGPDEYMIIFASGLDTYSNGYMHTNFKLKAEGECLALIRPDKQTIAFEYKYKYPQQYTDISFGMNGDIDKPVYFATPTPGAVNAIATTKMPTILQPGIFFSENVMVEITKASPDDTIRYTLNGTDPTEDSDIYTGPITITNTTTLKAVSFKLGCEMSPITCERYSRLNADVLGFNSDLPIVIVDTFNTEIPIPPDRETAVPKVLTLSSVIDTNTAGRAYITDEPDFAGRAGISVRGSSSEYFPKKMYHLETWDIYHEDMGVEFLDLPKESDWVLYAPYSDKTLMRNALIYKWWEDTERYSVRTRFVEMFLNVDDGSVSLSDYVGVYVIVEKIKRDENRVDIAKITRWDNEEPEVTGGYIIKRDRADPNDFGFYCMLGYVYYVEPKEEELTQPQIDWIKGYVSDFETALKSAYMADPVEGYAKYIDVDSFLDYQLFTEMVKDVDAYGLSTFMYKDKGGKLTMGPVWDHNLSIGNAFYGGGGGTYNPIGWNWESQGTPYEWYRKLFLDPEFQLRHADHWWQLRRTVFDVDNIMEDVNGFAEILRESAERNFDRWKIWVDPNLESPLPEGTEPHVWDVPDVQPYWIEVSILDGWVWPNKYFGTPDNPRTYQDEIDWMKGWIIDRINWIDTQFIKPPIFNQQGGYVDIGFELTITKPAGVSGKIYYTTDGIDPHQIPQSSSIALVEENSQKTVLVPTSDIGNSWSSEIDYNDSVWMSGTGGVGYETSSGYENYFNINIQSQMYDENASCYIRVPFIATAEQIAGFTNLTLRIRYDDGFTAYINGEKICSENSYTSLSWNSISSATAKDAEAVVYQDIDVTDKLSSLVAGQNLLAIQGLNSSATSTDFLISVELIGSTNITGMAASAIEYTGPITLDKSVEIQARVLDGDQWLPLNKAVFSVGPVTENLRITEIMYHPQDAPDSDPNAEFIELKNIGTEAINLNLVKFTNGVYFSFDDTALAAGGYIIVIKDTEAFEAQYSGTINIAGIYEGSLSNGGEKIELEDATGTNIHEFKYEDDWYLATDGNGYSLTIINPANPDLQSWSLASAWWPSYIIGGTPGTN